MDRSNIVQNLRNICKTSTVLQDEPMKKHTSFKVGGIADIYVKADQIEDIKTIVNFAEENNIPLTVIGNGSNILVTDKGIRGIVLEVNLQKQLFEKQADGILVLVGAGVKLTALAVECKKQSLTGFEFAYGIPGTIGGAVRMNAGAHGAQMQDVVISTTYLDFDGNIKILENKDQEFGYRQSIFSKNNMGIIIESKLKFKFGDKVEIEQKMNEYSTYRKEKQPISYPSAGSTFKRGNDFITAKLIDECGLKGYQIGGARISDLHAGFIINIGNATATDILQLIDYTKQKVYEKFEKNIELEIEIIGEK
ncbi:MAG: UDP-N-acetylmuramate dehydrogenase [Clostridia bacterium]|nr:UDP-N-acetylmuramate dehydrogenase [Clostridia bacterium]